MSTRREKDREKTKPKLPLKCGQEDLSACTRRHINLHQAEFWKTHASWRACLSRKMPKRKSTHCSRPAPWGRVVSLDVYEEKQKRDVERRPSQDVRAEAVGWVKQGVVGFGWKQADVLEGVNLTVQKEFWPPLSRCEWRGGAFGQRSHQKSVAADRKADHDKPLAWHLERRRVWIVLSSATLLESVYWYFVLQKGGADAHEVPCKPQRGSGWKRWGWWWSERRVTHVRTKKVGAGSRLLLPG